MARFYETVFLGGGISCLAAARALGTGRDWILLEREARVGGLCRTDRVDGFSFDRTGHLLHLRHPKIRALVRRLLGDNLVECQRNSWVYSCGVYTRYPFQAHFFGLPPEVVADCLLGVLEAAGGRGRPRAPAQFADWAVRAFGAGVARHFMFPYNRKLWTLPPEELSAGWLGRFVPTPDLHEVVLGALEDRIGAEGYNARFLYPRRGGIETLVRALARGLESRLHTGIAIERIDLARRRLKLSTGDELGFGRLVSCAPLPELVRMADPVPDGVRRVASALRVASVYNLNLGIADRGEDKHWVYVPEDRFAIYRFGFASNFTRYSAPAGMANIYTEVSYRRGQPLDRHTVRERVIRDLLAIGVIHSRREIVAEQAFDLPFGYAIFDARRDQAVARIRKFFESRQIFPVGRYGRWEYSSMEDALLQGQTLVEKVLSHPSRLFRHHDSA